MTDQNTLALKNKLTITDWSSAYNASDTNSAYDTFLNKFNTIFNKLLLVVNKRVRAYSDVQKPWISFDLIKSISWKNSAYKNHLKKKTPLALEKYKNHKNKLTNLIHTSEKFYYQDKFNSAMGDIKKNLACPQKHCQYRLRH